MYRGAVFRGSTVFVSSSFSLPLVRFPSTYLKETATGFSYRMKLSMEEKNSGYEHVWISNHKPNSMRGPNGDNHTTIGRHLRRLEQRGFLESKKYDGRSRGRTITEKGLERIRTLSAGRTQARAIANVIEMLHNGGDKQLRNVLVTRAIIELEVAALAARRATEENLAAIQKILDEMVRLTNEGQCMAATDAPFHIEIAWATGNPVLESVMQMIRTDYDYSPEIECIINASAQVNPGDHWSIYKAIREHNPEQARRIMKQHIQNIIEKLDSYEKEKMEV